MRTLTSGTLVVQAYDERVWKQERNVLLVSDENATKCQLCWPTLGTVLATYTLDLEHKVEIDLSDFIRLHADGANDVYIKTNSTEGNSVNANYVVAGLISPQSLIIPHDDNHLGGIIEPPSMMLACVNVDTDDAEVVTTIFIPARYSETVTFLDEQGEEISSEAIEPDVVTSVTIPYNAAQMVLSHRTPPRPAVSRKINIVPLMCGRDYVAVRWTDALGATRVHTWIMTKRKSETVNPVDLLTQDGSYKILKGRRDGFAIRLDDLNVYDYWYYSDVCYSSKVEVSFDGNTWQRVNVTTKSVSLPDGNAGKLNKLEVELNYKEYDAVDL